MYWRLDNILSEPRSPIGADRERHLVRKVTSELHVGEESREAIRVHAGSVVSREETTRSASTTIGSVAPPLVVQMRLVLALIFVPSVRKLDEERLRRAG